MMNKQEEIAVIVWGALITCLVFTMAAYLILPYVSGPNIDSLEAPREGAFVNEAELRHFLTEDQTDRLLWTPGWDCDDFADRLQANAEAAGYRMDRQIMQGDEAYHIMNTAEVGNWYYLVEPQTDRYWRYIKRD